MFNIPFVQSHYYSNFLWVFRCFILPGYADSGLKMYTILPSMNFIQYTARWPVLDRNSSFEGFHTTKYDNLYYIELQTAYPASFTVGNGWFAYLLVKYVRIQENEYVQC